MRNVLFLALLVSVVALSYSMPKNCLGPRCQPRPGRLVQGRPVGAPVPVRPNNLPPAALSRPIGAPVPVRPNNLQAAAVRRPALSVTKVPAIRQPVLATEQKMVTDADGKEVREAGVNGWLSEPTPSPSSPGVQARTEPPSETDKPGSCDTPKGFGIKCMDRLDQCTIDNHCPGTTKCCMVGDCGYLCVKPKPVSTGPKEVTKPAPAKKTKGDKYSLQEDLTTQASELIEAVEVPEGAVKKEDIIVMHKEEEQEEEEMEEMKKSVATEGEAETEEEQQKETMKKSVAEVAKEIEKEDETLTKEAEKVLEKVEEVIEEELEQIFEEEEEEIEATTQVPLEGDEEEIEATTQVPLEGDEEE